MKYQLRVVVGIILLIIYLFRSWQFSYSQNKLKRYGMSQISKETGCKIIELKNDSAIYS